MTRAEIIELQKRIGATPDGFWGPRSTKAAQDHLRKLIPVTDFPYPWNIEDVYGPPATGITRIDVTGLGLQFNGQTVNSVQCHMKVAESLFDILREISLSEYRWILSTYAGVFNNRNIRGGTRKSLHAYGAAIDLWPGPNGNHTHWPTRAKMPIQVMEIFAKHGWLSAGAFWSRDAMHFQATK
jgi:hypothetical protein